MNFDLTDDQLLFRDTVERFCGSFDLEVRKRTRALPGGVDPARWRELADLGLLALPAGDRNGGIGGSLADCAVVAEALGKAVALEPWFELAFWPLRILEGVTGAEDLAGRIARGETLAAVAFAEPGGRYRIDPVDTRASDSRLTGTKTFVLGGDAAGELLVTALSDGAPALFRIAVDQTERRGYTIVDGGRAAEIVLPGVSAEPLGTVALENAVTDARLIVAAELVGLATRLFDETLAFVRQREQFGQPIGRFQAIQHRLVDGYTRLEQMRSTLWRAILDDRPAGRAARIAGAKAFIAERALLIGHEAIQMHGGMGVTDELIIGHAHKRVMLLAKLFGDPASDLVLYAEAA